MTRILFQPRRFDGFSEDSYSPICAGVVTQEVRLTPSVSHRARSGGARLFAPPHRRPTSLSGLWNPLSPALDASVVSRWIDATVPTIGVHYCVYGRDASKNVMPKHHGLLTFAAQVVIREQLQRLRTQATSLQSGIYKCCVVPPGSSRAAQSKQDASPALDRHRARRFGYCSRNF